MSIFFEVKEGIDDSFYWAMPEPWPDNLERKFLGKRKPRNPPTYVVNSGRVTGDSISFGVFSDRVIALFNDLKATGFGSYRATVKLKGKQLAGYQAIYVYGRGAHFDPTRSRARYSKDGQTLMGYEGIFVEEMGGDGSDIFAIPGLGIGVFVDWRIASALESAGLKNIGVTRADHCKMP